MEKIFPQFLQDMLEKQHGKEISEEIILEYEKEKTLTFRVNNIKSNINEIKEILEGEGIEYKKIPWYDEAFIISNSEFTKIKELDIYKQGNIYVQSLSSMIPAIFLAPKNGENILDMAAAPGRKNNANCCNIK